MAGKHSLRIDFDDDTGKVEITHRCVVSVAGIDVSHSEVIPVPDDAVGTMRALLAIEDEYGFKIGRGENAVMQSETLTRREYMEKITSAMAISHVSAVQKIKQPGVKTLHVGGSVGAMGGASQTKV